MRLVNCKIIRREIEEADYEDSLAGSVLEHLAGCEQCQTFYDERRKLRQLVASLETVAAPPDFDLGLRSRLANEAVGATRGFWFSNFSFGIPSIAFATLALVIGGVIAFKTWNASTVNSPVQLADIPKSSDSAGQREQPSPIADGLKSSSNSQRVATYKHGVNGAGRNQQPKKRSRVSSTAVATSRNGRRLDTREFSTTVAPVVKKEDAVASLESPIFPIETSSQPLRLSLDYSGGVSRTISVPALSFGSERVLAGDGLSLVKNAPKGAW